MTAMAPEMTADVPNAVPIPKLTTRRRLLLNGLADGKSMADAAKDARMQRESGYRAIEEMKDQLPALMDGVGLDVRSILCRIREKMDATETKFIPRPEGIAERTVEAHSVQLKAIELAASLRPELRPDASVSVGTVNVLFANALPDWMQGNGDAVPQACRADASAISVQSGNGADLVHTDSGDNAPPPLSPLEGTGREPGGLGHTNSGNVDGAKCDSAANDAVSLVPVAPVPAKSKLANRVVKKRQPRLPVYRP